MLPSRSLLLAGGMLLLPRLAGAMPTAEFPPLPPEPAPAVPVLATPTERAPTRAPVAPPPAPAPTPVVERPPSPPPVQRFDDYRAQLAIADGAALGLALAAGLMRDGPRVPLAGNAAAIYLLGAPSVHELHGQTTVGAGSFAMRLATPLALGFLGVLSGGVLDLLDCELGHARECHRAATWGAVGLGIGVTTAIVVDDVFLGKARVETPPRSRRSGSGRAAVLPLADPERGTLGASLVGTF